MPRPVDRRSDRPRGWRAGCGDWLGDARGDRCARLALLSPDDVLTARRIARALASRLVLSETDRTMAATAVSEVARNVLHRAAEGELFLELVEAGGRRGLRVSALDRGPAGGGLGEGMRPGVARLMDEFEIASDPGRGTSVVMILWEDR